MSLLTYILIIVIFTFIDMASIYFWLMFIYVLAGIMINTEIPYVIFQIGIYIIPSIIMSIIPVGIVIAINRRKYKYNEISKREFIISNLIFALIKIAISSVSIFIMFRLIK